MGINQYFIHRDWKGSVHPGSQLHRGQERFILIYTWNYSRQNCIFYNIIINIVTLLPPKIIYFLNIIKKNHLLSTKFQAPCLKDAIVLNPQGNSER